MADRASWTWIAAGMAAVVTGCSALVGLDRYRDCQGPNECAAASGDGATDASATDASPDTPADVQPTKCATSADCALPAPLCDPDLHECLRIESLVKGSSGHICVVTIESQATRGMWCWGQNDKGQVGNASPDLVVQRPAKVLWPQGRSFPIQAALSSIATCALSGTGEVFCWGDAPGAANKTNAPFANVTLTKATAVSLGSSNACALLASGDVDCWGSNAEGEFVCDDGGHTSFPPTQPVAIGPLSNVSEIGIGSYALCSRKTSVGAISCRGANGEGQFAQPANSATCQAGGGMISTTALDKIWGTDLYFCARDINNAHYCWGDASSCQILGVGCAPTAQPAELVIPSYARAALRTFAPGWRHACAAMADDKVQCWGQNDHGQVGDPAKFDPQNHFYYTSAVAVVGLDTEKVVDMAAYRHMTCVLTAKGQVLCWGQNGENAADGRLGVGSVNPNVLSPTPVAWP